MGHPFLPGGPPGPRGGPDRHQRARAQVPQALSRRRGAGASPEPHAARIDVAARSLLATAFAGGPDMSPENVAPLSTRAGARTSPVPSSKRGHWRHQMWLALLVFATVGFSLVFACAVPFAGLAVAAAFTLSRRDALGVTLAVWLANQLVGYLILDYPRTANSFAWGAVLGITVLLTTLVARWTVLRLQTAGPVVSGLVALLAAVTFFEAGLLAVAAAGLGGTSTFAPALVARIFGVNVIALAGLAILNRIGAAAGIRDSVALPVPATEPSR